MKYAGIILIFCSTLKFKFDGDLTPDCKFVPAKIAEYWWHCNIAQKLFSSYTCMYMWCLTMCWIFTVYWCHKLLQILMPVINFS